MSSETTHNNTFANCYNIAFADRSEEDEIFPLTISEIADAQRADKHLCKLFKCGGENKSATNSTLNTSQYQVSLVENIKVLTNSDSDLTLVIPKPLQMKVIKCYHYYLQHPGHNRLESTLHATMTWSGMWTAV